MKKNYFNALEEVYTDGGIGNTLMCDFYDNRTAGGGEVQFARLAVYMELKYGIKSTKQIKTDHIYELLEFLKNEGFKDATLKGYISAFRLIFRNGKHLFSEGSEMPSNSGFVRWIDKELVQLTAMRNIGETMSSKLKAVGISSAEELIKTGSKEAYIRLKTVNPNFCLTHLYTLQAAIEDIDLNMLSQDTKDDLKAFNDNLKWKFYGGK